MESFTNKPIDFKNKRYRIKLIINQNEPTNTRKT